MAASKLQQRILTALLIVPLPVAADLLLPTPYLAFCFGLVLLPAAWEWAVLVGISSLSGRIAYAALVVLGLILLWQPPLRHWLPDLIAFAAVFWCAVGIFLLRLRVIEHRTGLDPTMALIGLVVLVGPWVALVYLHAHSPNGPYLVLFFLALIWAADILAYFAGRQWGREKLAPLISPGKTRAGLYGALGGAALCGALLGWLMGMPPWYILLLAVLCIVVAFISVIGDLFESFVKRRRDMKDSGSLLPGHGGVLDRIDSLTAAAPLFTLAILWLESRV